MLIDNALRLVAAPPTSLESNSVFGFNILAVVALSTSRWVKHGNFCFHISPTEHQSNGAPDPTAHSPSALDESIEQKFAWANCPGTRASWWCTASITFPVGSAQRFTWSLGDSVATNAENKRERERESSARVRWFCIITFTNLSSLI